jgi:hypothetical protein
MADRTMEAPMIGGRMRAAVCLCLAALATAAAQPASTSLVEGSVLRDD